VVRWLTPNVFTLGSFQATTWAVCKLVNNTSNLRNISIFQRENVWKKYILYWDIESNIASRRKTVLLDSGILRSSWAHFSRNIVCTREYHSSCDCVRLLVLHSIRCQQGCGWHSSSINTTLLLDANFVKYSTEVFFEQVFHSWMFRFRCRFTLFGFILSAAKRLRHKTHCGRPHCKLYHSWNRNENTIDHTYAISVSIYNSECYLL
jgi:hypothetical protein